MELSDVALGGYRSLDLQEQKQIGADTLFAAHRELSARRLDYGSLSADVRPRALSAMHVGTMAFADTWEYSTSSHGHDCYTYAAVSAGFGPGESMIKLATISAGDMYVDGLQPGKCRIIDVYCPEVRVSVPEEPHYGTLRFAYRQDSVHIDQSYISSDQFDGWVYPDGSTWTVDPAQFRLGSNPFVTRASNPFVKDGVLSAPDLRGLFISFNPFTERERDGENYARCAFGEREGHVAVPEHDHLITDFSAHVQLEFDKERSAISVTNDYNKYGVNTLHWGITGQKPDQDLPYTAQLSFKSHTFSLSTDYAGDASAWSEPSHWAMPVMVYVGGRLKDYDRKYFT